jgi:hypothetical protein
MPSLRRRGLSLAIVALVLGIASLGVARPARDSASLPRASGFEGLYLRRGDSWLDYYQLTEASNLLTGFYTVVRIDLRAQAGARTDRTEVNGTAQGSTASLRMGSGSGIFSSPIGTAVLSGGTLTISAPSADGRIANAVYRRASQNDVNSEVSALRSRAGLSKRQNDEAARVQGLRSELAQLLREIPRLEAERARLATVVQSAKQDLTQATSRLGAARAEVLRAREAANQAYRAARTPDDQVRAGQLDVAAGEAEARAGAVEADESASQANVHRVQDELRDCERELQQARVRASTDSAALRLR